MNTILLQKILDLLKDNLTGVGSFIKSVFVHDPQDNQILSYDAEIGKWVNKDSTEVELDLTNTFVAQPIATITDGAENVPMKSLVCEIVPKETGTGQKSPSNPYTISGTDEVVITHTGKNLCNLATRAESTTLGITSEVQADNLIIASGESTGNGDIKITFSSPLTFKSGINYTLSLNGTDIRTGTLSIYFHKTNGTYGTTVSMANNKHSITTTQEGTFDYLLLRTTNTNTVNINAKVQIETGTTATTYEPYTATTETIALPSTVYGGEVDVVSGHGTETQAILELDGSSDEYWATYISQNGFYLQIPDMKTLNGETDYHCNYLKVTSTWTDALGIRYGANNKFIYCLHITDNITGVTDVETWRTYLSNNHLVITYPLATPTPITTTPIQIKTQGGTESIYSDAGDVSGEYYTATAGTIKDLVSITEDITSSVTKNTTDFSDILFKASKNNKVVSIELYSASTSSALISTFLSNLPKPAMNCKVLLANTTLGEDGIILGTLKTTGELEITTTGAKTFSGIITYVEK